MAREYRQMDSEKVDESSIRETLLAAKDEIADLGGVSAFRSGDWLLKLILKSFRNYSERSTAEYFSVKYPSLSREHIAEKLIHVACVNTAMAGGITGAAVSIDELLALFEFGIGIPANVAVGFTAIAGELLWITKCQLQLVANLGVLYEVPLDVDDPEDIITILEFASGGAVRELLGKEVTKISGRLTKTAVRKYVAKEVLEALQRVARKIGYKLLQQTIISVVVPGVSIVVGALWNKRTTKIVGKKALKHFEERRRLRTSDESSPSSIK
jgi:uncharacterized protein (DUF697 family)